MLNIRIFYICFFIFFISSCGVQEPGQKISDVTKRAGDGIQREVIPSGESVLIEGFETIQDVGRGHAAARINTPELQQTDNALEGQKAGLVVSEGTMFGVYNSPKENWRGMYMNVEEGAFEHCTGISFWVRSREAVENQPINIIEGTTQRRGSNRCRAFFSIPGDNEWHQVTIPFFGDALHIVNPLFTPSPDKITSLDFIIPYNRPYSFAIDKLEGIRAPAGDIPLPEVVSIRDMSDERLSGIEELREYEDLALEAQVIMWESEKTSDAHMKMKSAQKLLQEYVDGWKTKYQEQENTYSYQRGLFRLNQVLWYNQIDIDRLEVWKKYSDATIIEQTPFVPEQYREYPILLSDITYMSQGLRITGVIAKPKGEGPFPLVLVNHGGYSHAKDHLVQVMRVASAGFVTIASDYRGHGGSEGRDGSNFQEVELYGRDAVNGLKAAKTLPYVDASRIGLWGHSMGGFVSWYVLTSEVGQEIDAYAQISSRITVDEEKLSQIKCPLFVVVGENEGLLESHPQTLSLLDKYKIPYESKTYPGYDHHNMKFHHPLSDAVAFFQRHLMNL